MRTDVVKVKRAFENTVGKEGGAGGVGGGGVGAGGGGGRGAGGGGKGGGGDRREGATEIGNPRRLGKRDQN